MIALFRKTVFKYYLYLFINLFFITNLVKAENLDSILIKSLIDSAAVYQTINSDTALYLGRYALKLSKENDDLLNEAESMRIIASIYQYNNKNDSALMYYRNVVELLTKRLINNSQSKVAELLSASYNDIAEIHIDIGNVTKALEYNQKSIDLNDEYKILNKQINALVTKGKIYYTNRNLDSAKFYWNKGLKISESLKNNDLTGRLLNNLGSLSYHNGNWNEGLNYFKKAYDLQKRINNETEIARAANNIGLSYFMLKDYYRSLPNYLDALQLAERHNMIESQLISLNYLIQVYMYLNDTDKAREMFLRFGNVLDEYFASEQLKVINELEIKYEVDKKNKEIELLEKQKLIDDLNYKQSLEKKNRVIIIVVFSIIVIVLFLLLRFQNYKKQQAINRQKVLFQKIVTEQKMLRSQMNPHFIYNSLNSIQSFISSDESYQAEKYLARFAKLMRGILENSREDFVLLEKEIEVLELYIELEQLRFENKFTYEIKVDSEIEADFIAIPPMIIQPFIENAILHGLRTKEKGKLTLEISEKEESIVCVIDDNGIGREESGKLNQNKNKKSLATEITRERLETLSVQMKQPAFFIIEDKKDENDKPVGTKVTVEIPIAKEIVE